MRPSQIATVAQAERELDLSLAQLRATEPGNTNARGAIEYRIGAIRRRIEILSR